MRRATRPLILTLGLLLLVGCATQPLGELKAAGMNLAVGPTETGAVTQGDSPLVAALGRLADNPLIRAATKDADATLAWVEANKVTLGPLKEFRARQCPTAIKLAAADLREKVLALQQRVRDLGARRDERPSGPTLVLDLTRLKFGDAPDPKAVIDRMKDDIGNRIAAVSLSCLEIFPAEQVADLARLAGRAGLITTPLGALLP